MPYFNYRVFTASGRWERRAFIREWWRIFARDIRWVPPHYPTLVWGLNPAQNDHLARLEAEFARIEALPQQQNPNRDDPGQADFMPGAIEVTVVASLVLRDNRRRDSSAYLALPHVVNDEESLERLLDHVAQEVMMTGCSRLIAPTGLSPHLGSGWLLDHWHLLPPAHTPYNPPYLSELVERFMEPLGSRRYLYHLPVPDSVPSLVQAPVELVSFEPARLAGDLRSLFVAACENEFGFAPPDEVEVAFLLRWLGPAPLIGRLALIAGRPAGFVLMQPDLAPLLHGTKGGRNWLRRFWLAISRGRSMRQGRLLFGAVLPEYRRQGIGRQLLQQVLATAWQQGWESVTVGPLPASSAAESLLRQQGAQQRQTYQLYEWTF